MIKLIKKIIQFFKRRKINKDELKLQILITKYLEEHQKNDIDIDYKNKLKQYYENI